MRVGTNELIIIAIIIIYIAFFSNPPPAHILNFLESPVGHIVVLVGLLYVTAYKSLIVGVFLGIAYIMTARRVTEYLDETEQTPTTPEKKLTSAGVPSPATSNALQSLLSQKPHEKNPVIHDMLNGKGKLNKLGDKVKHTQGDTRLPQEEEKAAAKPPSTTVALPKADERKESFTERFSPF